jgi:hypothetical protein
MKNIQVMVLVLIINIILTIKYTMKTLLILQWLWCFLAKRNKKRNGLVFKEKSFYLLKTGLNWIYGEKTGLIFQN